MSRGGSTPLFMAARAKALCLLLLTASGCFLSTTAHIARATTTSLSSCGEGGGKRCPDSLENTPTRNLGVPGAPEGSGRGLTGIASASPTPSPAVFANSTAAAECEEESATCLADEECQGCYEIATGISNSEEFEACRKAYLGVGSSSSSNLTLAASSMCNVVGAMYCCSNEISENDCLAGDKSSLYWGCVFEGYGCELEEVACLAVGESYRSDDDDVGGRASNPLSAGAGNAAAPWLSGAGCVAVAALGLAAATSTSMVI